MSRSRRIVVVGAVVAALGVGVTAAVLAAGGSGSGDGSGNSDGDGDVRVVQPGAPGEDGQVLTDEEAADVTAPEHSPADTTFMQDMLVHHQQALEMTELVEGRAESSDVPLLSERITVSQEDEIERIEEWLTDRGEEVPEVEEGGAAADHAQHAGMPGMATPEQVDQLEQAQGAAFDRLFLELMIAHHQGALTMVDDLYAAGGGVEVATDQFARDVEADQNIEILRMQELLGTLP